MKIYFKDNFSMFPWRGCGLLQNFLCRLLLWFCMNMVLREKREEDVWCWWHRRGWTSVKAVCSSIRVNKGGNVRTMSTATVLTSSAILLSLQPWDTARQILRSRRGFFLSVTKSLNWRDAKKILWPLDLYKGP